MSIEDKHLTGIVAAIGSIAAVFFPVAQVWVAHIDKVKDIELAQIEKDRHWGLDAADFLLKNRDIIFPITFDKNDQIRRDQMQAIISATFPHDLALKIFTNAQFITQPKQRLGWSVNLENLDATAEDQELKSKSLDIPSQISTDYIKSLVSNFQGPNRRIISRQISDLYVASKEIDKKAIITGLVDSLKDQNNYWSYRVNLYIATTLEATKAWNGSDEEYCKIVGLKDTDNSQDKTFEQRVNGAISTFKGQKPEPCHKNK